MRRGECKLAWVFTVLGASCRAELGWATCLVGTRPPPQASLAGTPIKISIMVSAGELQ